MTAMRLQTAPSITAHATGLGYEVAGTAKTITPVLRPSIYDNEHGKWDAVLVITRPGLRGTKYRFQIGYVDPTGSCRREYQGEILPGPYAYAYGLATCIASDPRMGTAAEVAANEARGLEVAVEDGDIIRLGWELFRVRYLRDQWIELDHVGSAR
jgi:hypothetical protein